MPAHCTSPNLVIGTGEWLSFFSCCSHPSSSPPSSSAQRLLVGTSSTTNQLRLRPPFARSDRPRRRLRKSTARSFKPLSSKRNQSMEDIGLCGRTRLFASVFFLHLSSILVSKLPVKDL